MRVIIIFFTLLTIGSLLFTLYFTLTPIFDPLRFERSGLDAGRRADSTSYFYAAFILVVIFSVSAICLTRLIRSSEQMSKG